MMEERRAKRDRRRDWQSETDRQACGQLERGRETKTKITDKQESDRPCVSFPWLCKCDIRE